MNPKQEIFNRLYVFNGSERVLDIGCGEINPFLNVLEYEGVDLKFGLDWSDHNPCSYDVIIANDIFPNSDQRLCMFLEKYIPHCNEMRLSLTYFDKPKWYRAIRPEGETLTVLQWTQKQVLDAICKYTITKLEPYEGTFQNGRKVLLAWLKGEL